LLWHLSLLGFGLSFWWHVLDPPPQETVHHVKLKEMPVQSFDIPPEGLVRKYLHRYTITFWDNHNTQPNG